MTSLRNKIAARQHLLTDVDDGGTAVRADPVGPDDAGMTTAEYAIGTLAACGFAALLVTILRSGEVQGLLLGIIRSALDMGLTCGSAATVAG